MLSRPFVSGELRFTTLPGHFREPEKSARHSHGDGVVGAAGAIETCAPLIDLSGVNLPP